MMSESNAWNHIPLGDYEQHMQHAAVGQAQLLNELTGRYLQKYDPDYLLFLGVSGGNGLEYIDTNQVKRVCAVDINRAYLDATHQRFGNGIKQLELIHADIRSSKESFIKADWVWAALLFEYVDLQAGFDFIRRNTGETATLIITIQANNGVQSVSETGIDSIKSVASIFKIVDKDQLTEQALTHGFGVIGEEEIFLPNGKSLRTYAFSKGNVAVTS